MISEYRTTDLPKYVVGYARHMNSDVDRYMRRIYIVRVARIDVL